MSPVVKNGPASYIVPGRARYMSFWSPNCQHKVHWARFSWEMGCTKFWQFIFSATGESICTDLSSASADTSVVLA